MWYWNRGMSSDIALTEEEITDMVWDYYWRNIPEEEVERFINRRNEAIKFRDAGDKKYSAAKAIFLLDRILYDELRSACVNFKTACANIRRQRQEHEGMISNNTPFEQATGIPLPFIWRVN